MAVKKATIPKALAALEPFAGFPKAGIGWFEALAMAQNRDWFQAHRNGYEDLWLKPMQALLNELAGPLGQLYGKRIGPAKVFRLNRDVRFSKDKSPYKTHIGGLLPFEGFEPMKGPAGLYLQLGLQEMVAFGFYMLEPASVARLRRALLDEKTGPSLAALVHRAAAAGLHPDAMETLKRPPPGVSAEHPRVELLKRKALALSRADIPKKVRFGAQLKPWLLEQANAAAPVVKWGLAHGL